MPKEPKKKTAKKKTLKPPKGGSGDSGSKPHITGLDEFGPCPNDVVHASLRDYAKVHIGAALVGKFEGRSLYKEGKKLSCGGKYSEAVELLVDSLFPKPVEEHGVIARTGADAPFSGIYTTICCGKEVAVSVGESLIPCPGCREAADWKLIRATR